MKAGYTQKPTIWEGKSKKINAEIGLLAQFQAHNDSTRYLSLGEQEEEEEKKLTLSIGFIALSS